MENQRTKRVRKSSGWIFRLSSIALSIRYVANHIASRLLLRFRRQLKRRKEKDRFQYFCTRPKSRSLRDQVCFSSPPPLSHCHSNSSRSTARENTAILHHPISIPSSSSLSPLPFFTSHNATLLILLITRDQLHHNHRSE